MATAQENNDVVGLRDIVGHKNKSPLNLSGHLKVPDEVEWSLNCEGLHCGFEARKATCCNELSGVDFNLKCFQKFIPELSYAGSRRPFAFYCCV
jgi:hypothetical protein